MTRSLRCAAVAAIAVLAPACGTDPISPEALAGTYALVDVEGQPLPARFAVAPPEDEIIYRAGQLTLTPDRTFTLRLAFTVTTPPDFLHNQVDDYAGEYDVTGTDLRMALPSGPVTGRAASDRVHLTIDGRLFTFERAP